MWEDTKMGRYSRQYNKQINIVTIITKTRTLVRVQEWIFRSSLAIARILLGISPTPRVNSSLKCQLVSSVEAEHFMPCLCPNCMYVFTKYICHWQNVIQGQLFFLRRLKLVWIQSFLSSLVDLQRLKNSVFPSWREIDGFMPFTKALSWSWTQTTSPKIWTLVIGSISYSDNH